MLTIDDLIIILPSLNHSKVYNDDSESKTCTVLLTSNEETFYNDL